MENKRFSNKESVSKIRKAGRIAIFVFKAGFLLGVVIFFAYLMVGAVLIKSSVNSAEILRDGEGRAMPSLTRLAVDIEASSVENLITSASSIIFSIFFIALILIFLSPIAFILKKIIEDFTQNSGVFFLKVSEKPEAQNEAVKIDKPFRHKLLEITRILFSHKTQKEVFQLIMGDWDEEIYQILADNKEANLFMVNTRNTYSFLAAMWQKSPIGDLIEFISKLAK